MKMRVVVVSGFVLLTAACGPTAAPVAVDPNSIPASPVATSQPAQEIAIPDEGNDHVSEGTEVAYQNNPPASGPHYAVVLQYGLYEGEDIPAPYWVHSLEHGAIVVLYKCDQPCPDLVQSLGDMLDLFPLSKWDNRKIVIVPYRQMDAPLMAVAWNVQMPLEQFEPQALIDFYSRHVDQGPEDVP
jgi:hypothetical protein